MNTQVTFVRSAAKRWVVWLSLTALLSVGGYVPPLSAQDDEGDEGSEEESSFTVNAMMKMQGGLFVPLASDGFQPQHNEAYVTQQTGFVDLAPCDPVAIPRRPCQPSNHGQKPGSTSIARATLQVEAHWDFTSKLALHTIFRGVRSAPLDADEYAQVPTNLDAKPGETPEQLSSRRRAYSKDWVRDNYYNRLDLREFYLDAMPTNWLTFRIGRQQVAWGETGQFRLLDVVNPIDSSWHFGSLEAFEDQRVPLWMLFTTIDINKLNGALELLYIPGLDRGRDTVSTPLSMVGAWGVPYSNQPPTFRSRYKDFQYPGGELAPENMRGGFRWKADAGAHASYSLVYMYTHMQTPVLDRAILAPTAVPGVYDSQTADRTVLTFPRQHIVGGSFEYAFDSPIGLTARFEGSLEPNRTFSQNTNTGDSDSQPGKIIFTPKAKPVVNYALVVQRPTMIRWLNPTQNFLLVAQFMHSAVANLDPVKDSDWVQVVGYNDWSIQKNSYTLVFYATTNYFHGIFTPRLTGVYIPNPYYEDSGFVSLDLGFRIGPHYRVNVMATDFVGKNPYRDLGLFRDRDEIHASLTVLF